jgi:hypothetical protein
VSESEVGYRTMSLSSGLLQGLQAIRCPAGLYFDIEKQTCDWKDAVKNCKLKNKERKVKPLLYTDEPLCQVCNLVYFTSYLTFLKYTYFKI